MSEVPADTAKLRLWAADPRTFVRQCFDIGEPVVPDPWQDDVLAAFPTHQRLAVKGSKGPGKSTLAAWLILNFLATRPHPKVAATSISGDNLRDGLWTELAKWISRSTLLKAAFTWSAERITCDRFPETWWASARQWSKSADPSKQADTLAGLHADHLLFVLDESGGTPRAVMAAAEAGLSTGKETHILQLGNPTDLQGPLYDACTKERDLWHVTEVSGDPDNPRRSPRVSVTWAREQIRKYGPTDPWVLVNVFGQFPPGQSNALISLADVDAAVVRKLQFGEHLRDALVAGLDVGGMGRDESALVLRQGRMCFEPITWRNLDEMQLVGQVARILDERKVDACFVDACGIGAGVASRLIQLGYHAFKVDSAKRANRTEPSLFNHRAEMWWEMGQWVKTGVLPDDQVLRSELPGPTIRFNDKNQLKLETKDEMKARGLSSPNRADALAYTFAMPVVPQAQRLNDRQHKTVHDYDPYAAADQASPPRVVTDYDPLGASL